MKKIVNIVLLLSLLTACGGSGGGKSPTKEFQLFPDNYLAAGFSESYAIIGEDQRGIPFTGTYRIERWPESEFNSQPTIPLFEILKYQNLFTNAVITSTSYYTTSLSALEIVDIASSLQPGVETVSSASTVIPRTARIGDSGEIGTYIDNAGNTTVFYWDLTRAPNGRAYLTLYGSITDQFEELTGTLETTYTISANGNRSNVSIILHSAKQNITLNFSGNKQT